MSPEEPKVFYQASFDLFESATTAPAHLPISACPPREPTETERLLQIQADGYAVYFFAKDDPATNCFRRYVITYQPSLWDKYTVSRQWGRVGSARQQRRDRDFSGPRPALSHIQRLIQRRLKRGYRLTKIS